MFFTRNKISTKELKLIILTLSKLELVHARLYLMNYYFKSEQFEKAPHPLEAKMKKLIGRIIMFCEYFEQDQATNMKSIFSFLKFCVELEMEVMKDLIGSNFGTPRVVQ